MRSAYEERLARSREIQGHILSGRDKIVPPPNWVHWARHCWPDKTAAHLAAIAGGKDERTMKCALAALVIASHYGWESGPLTANGEKIDPAGMTAAHRSLPFGTQVKVSTENGNSIVVRINDRGPFKQGREIDLTDGAASALGFEGLAKVCLEVQTGKGQVNARSRSDIQPNRNRHHPRPLARPRSLRHHRR